MKMNYEHPCKIYGIGFRQKCEIHLWKRYLHLLLNKIVGILKKHYFCKTCERGFKEHEIYPCKICDM